MKRVWQWSRGVLALVVLGVAMLALPTSSAVAGNGKHLHGSIICPGSSQTSCCPPQDTGVPCCPLPTIGCCVSATSPPCCTVSSCPQTLSIGVTPDPAIDGQQATISGTLTRGTVAGQPVDLWQRLPGQAAATDVAQTHTGSSGSFSFVRQAQTNVAWYATAGSATSATFQEQVRARIAMHQSAVRHASAVKLTLSGSISPSHAGERVALQQRRGRRWVTVAGPMLGAGSSFTVVRTLHGHSMDRFRVVLSSDARNARSVSSVVAVRG